MKKKSFEVKIYELIGIKYFRKLAFGLRNLFLFPMTLKMSKQERNQFYKNAYSVNYNIGKTTSIDKIKGFKKWLYINTSIHIFGVIVCFKSAFITPDISLYSKIINISLTCVNLYCIMLQRYNVIRINDTIKRLKPHYEKRKEKIIEEIKKEDTLLKDYTYKIVDKKENEEVITFDTLIENATIDDLKAYRNYLKYLKMLDMKVKEKSSNMDNNITTFSIEIAKNKVLKAELKRGK